MKRFVYADHAATTKLDTDAFEAMKLYLLDEYGNASQSYAFSRSPNTALREARETIASCIHADPDEIYFTSGGTESNNWAIKGTVFSSQDRKAIITSTFEHHSILRTCEAMKAIGCPVTYMTPKANGFVLADTLQSAITPQTLLVSLMMANNEIGTIQPTKELAEIAHRNGTVFHTDAVPCVGHLPIDVKELDVDMLSASAHKFNGPKGIGFLYIKRGVQIASLLHGGSQERGLRAGTENTASIVAMAVALKKNCAKLAANTSLVSKLENALISYLTESGIIFYRNGNGAILPGVLSLSFPGFEGEALMHRLDLMGIQVSTASACNSANTQISHVLQAIQVEEPLALGTIRISLGKENTIDDVTTIAQALKKIIKT